MFLKNLKLNNYEILPETKIPITMSGINCNMVFNPTNFKIMSYKIYKLELLAYLLLLAFCVVGCCGFYVASGLLFSAMIVVVAIDTYLFNKEIKKLCKKL